MTCGLRCVGHSLLLAGILGGLAFSEERPASETRRLTLAPRADWAALFYQIRGSPDNGEFREKLAAQYAAAGYVTVGQFFRHRPGRDRSADLVREAATWTTSAWRCADKPNAILQVRGVAQKISESIRAGRYGPALGEATSALGSFGPFCQLLVEWAEAVLYTAMLRGDDGSADSEAAGRILITGVDDLNIQPIDLELEGPTGVYEFLSQYFCAARDLVSCATALDFAVARLSRVPAAKAEEVDRWRARLQERHNSVLERLKSQR